MTYKDDAATTKQLRYIAFLREREGFPPLPEKRVVQMSRHDAGLAIDRLLGKKPRGKGPKVAKGIPRAGDQARAMAAMKRRNARRAQGEANG